MVMEMDEYNRQKEPYAEEINRLKEEIHKQKEAVSSIAELVKSEIDRDFPIDLWELSDRELDNEMGNRLSFLNDDIDTRPEPGHITSHRKILGKPVVLIKRVFMKLTRFYTNTLLEKQRGFNAQVVEFQLASFIRSRNIEKRILGIEGKLKTLEEDHRLISEQLDKLKNESTKPGTD
jgi:hypothetical protein